MRFLRLTVALLCAMPALAVIGPASAQAATPFERARNWTVELTNPQLVRSWWIHGSTVANTDDGPVHITHESATVREVPLPTVHSVYGSELVYCGPERITIADADPSLGPQDPIEVVFDVSASELGATTVGSCAVSNSTMLYLANPGTQNAKLRRVRRDGGGHVPEDIGLPYATRVLQIWQPGSDFFVEFADGSFAVGGFETELTPVGELPNTYGRLSNSFFGSRSGNVVTERTVTHGFTVNYRLPDGVDTLTALHSRRFYVEPGDDGRSELVAMTVGPDEDSTITHGRLPLPFTATQGQAKQDDIILVHGNSVSSVRLTPMILDLSPTEWDPLADSPILIPIWNGATDTVQVTANGRSWWTEFLDGSVVVTPDFDEAGVFPLTLSIGTTDVSTSVRVLEDYPYTSFQVHAKQAPGSDPGGTATLTTTCWQPNSARSVEDTREVAAGDVLEFAVAAHSTCRVYGTNAWFGDLQPDGSVLDIKGSDYHDITVGTDAVDIGVNIASDGRVPLWLLALQSGPDVGSRTVKLSCPDDKRTIELPLGELLRLSLASTHLCEITAEDRDGFDVNGVFAFDQTGRETSAFRNFAYATNATYVIVDDLNVHPLDDAGFFVEQTFSDVYGREPTGEELYFWGTHLEQNKVSRGDMADVLLRSTEFTRTSDALILLYQAYFGRLPDSDGLSYWSDIRRSGATIAEVSEQFAMSEEFTNLYGDADDDEFITLVYENVLDRTPDAEGYDYWRGHLRTGVTRGELMVFFSDSTEYRDKLSIQVQVVGAYQSLLARMPTSSELATWASASRDGATTQDLANQLVDGDEYVSRFFDHYRGERIRD